MAIVRRMAYGSKLFVADWKLENAQAITKTLVEAGFDAIPFKTDISSRAEVLELIKAARQEGEIAMFINAAGVSPSQSTKEHILAVDLYGTAVLLEEFGKVIKEGERPLLFQVSRRTECQHLHLRKTGCWQPLRAKSCCNSICSSPRTLKTHFMRTRWPSGAM